MNDEQIVVKDAYGTVVGRFASVEYLKRSYCDLFNEVRQLRAQIEDERRIRNLPING